METELEIKPTNSEVTRNTYPVKVEGGRTENIITFSKTFLPEGAMQQDLNTAVIYNPGWAMPIEGQSVTDIGTALADRRRGLGVQTIAMTASAEHAIDNPLYHEAEAKVKELLSRGIKKAVLVGHSRGGSVATNMAYIMQELQKQDPEIEVIALVLIDAMGTYEKNPFELAVKFTTDSIASTPATVAKTAFQRARHENPSGKLFKKPGVNRIARASRVGEFLHESLDVTKGIAKEIIQPRKFVKDVIAMAEENPRLKEIKTPVILIQGADDPIAHINKMAPVERKKTTPPQPEESIDDRHKRIEDNRRIRIKIVEAEQEYIKKHLLPKSSFVGVITPQNLGFHSGPMLRSDTLAHVIALTARKLNPAYFPKQPKLF